MVSCCAVSGTIPEVPVVDRNSGLLFEKRLLEKYLQESNGKNPINGEALLPEDIVTINTAQAAKPRTAPATSIPSILHLLHNEWDATMLEVNTLRKELGAVRQELSSALYQHDAAVRVIARLQRDVNERDILLERMEKMKIAPSAHGNGAAADPEESAAKKAKQGITKSVTDAITQIGSSVSKQRKKRQISTTLADIPQVTTLQLESTYPLHKTTQGGILAIDFEEGKEDVIFTAGVDHSGKVYDRSAGRVLSDLKGHSKKVTDVKFCAKHNLAITTSADKTAILHRPNAEGTFSPASVLRDHSAEIVSASLQITGDYLVTTSQDKTWCFYDIPTATCLQQVSDDSLTEGYSTAKFHPDGMLLGTGTRNSLVRIWEIRQQKTVAKLGHTKGPITSLSFSENGYYLTSAAEDGVKLWDLRKLVCVREFNTESAPSFVAFDHSGLYLAVGSDRVDIHAVKQDWSVVKTFTDMPKKGVYCGKWGTDAKSLFVGAADHNLRYFGVSTADNAESMVE